MRAILDALKVSGVLTSAENELPKDIGTGIYGRVIEEERNNINSFLQIKKYRIEVTASKNIKTFSAVVDRAFFELSKIHGGECLRSTTDDNETTITTALEFYSAVRLTK